VITKGLVFGCVANSEATGTFCECAANIGLQLELPYVFVTIGYDRVYGVVVGKEMVKKGRSDAGAAFC